MTATATKTPPAVNTSTIECSQVLVDNPVAEIKEDSTAAEEPVPAAAAATAGGNPKKRASPESKDDPESKKLDIKQAISNAENDDEQVAIAADVVPEKVVATNDDELRANLEIATNDKEIKAVAGIETKASINGPECLEAGNQVAGEETDAGSAEEYVAPIATEDKVECCA